MSSTSSSWSGHWAQFMTVHLGGGAGPSAELFTDLFRLGSRFELTIPAEVGTVLRAMATMEGTLTLVEPGFDLVVEARQYAGCRAGPTASPAPWNKAGSASTCGYSPTNATAGWSPT